MKRKFLFILTIFCLSFFSFSITSFALSFPPPSTAQMGPMSASIPDKPELPVFSKSSCRNSDVLKRSKTAIRFLKNVSHKEFIATGNLANSFTGGHMLYAPPFASGVNWIGNFDATKKPLWQYCFAKRSSAPMPDEAIQDLVVTPDGGYLGVGQSTFGRRGVIANGWVFKLKSNGDLQWQKLFGRTFDTNFIAASFVSALATPDHGYVIVGSVSQKINDSCSWSHLPCDTSYAFLMKLNSNGELQWQKSYGMDFEVNVSSAEEDDGIEKESTEGGFSFQRILPAEDGGFFVTGTTRIFGSLDAWFARFDKDGHVLWQKVFGKAKANEIASIREDHEGNLVIAGLLRFGFGQPWALKLDQNGSVLWQKILGKSSKLQMFDVEESVDQKGFVFLGRTIPTRAEMDSLLPVPQTLWIFQLDTKGNLVWQKGYRSILSTHSIGIQRSVDGYVLRSGSDLFPIDRQGNMRKFPPKILSPVKINYPSKEFTQDEVETDIHDYEIPISEE